MRIERIGDATLIHGDAYEHAPTLEPVNAIIIDPPYLLSNLGPGKSHFGMGLAKFESDSYKNITSGFDLRIFDLLSPICQPFNMFCFCSNKQISGIMAYHEAKGRSTTLLVWHKHNAVPFANGVWRGDAEYIVHARDYGAYFEGTAKQKTKVSNYPAVCDLAHPSVKPLSLIQKYVNICSKPGDTVLDCFMGSGTTGVACAKMGRKFIGIESEEKYFNLAYQRISQVYAQGELFSHN